ncbi:MAG: type II secretion system protein GspM [Candidatus Wenzhouxiangella sp. M2_3B_020]
MERWRQLQARERLLVGVAAIVIAAVLVWTLAWEPLAEARSDLRRQVAAERALLDWLDRLEPEVRRLRARAGPARSMEGRSMLALIDDSARAAGLAGALRRIEPGGTGEVRVDLSAAAFPDLMQWLVELSAGRPVVVERFSADRVGPGRVDSVVVLRRTDVGS